MENMPNYSPASPQSLAFSPALPTYYPESMPFASLTIVNIWFTRRNPFVYLDKIADELDIKYKFIDFEKHLELYHSMVQTNEWNVIGKGITLTDAREDAAKNAASNKYSNDQRCQTQQLYENINHKIKNKPKISGNETPPKPVSLRTEMEYDDDDDDS